MNSEAARPSLEEFQIACRDAFGFLTNHGFQEVSPHRVGNSFQVWFRRGDDFVIVQGESWGDMASTSLEHLSGVELATIYLVPPEARPPKWKRGKSTPTQLEQIRRNAYWLQSYGEDFLRGDLKRFFSLAKPLPPWEERLHS